MAAEGQWAEPLRWDRKAREAGKRSRVFCCSLADVFEDWSGQMNNTKGQPLWINYPHAVDEPASPAHGTAYGPCMLGHARARLWDLIRKTPHLDWLLLTKRPENIEKMMPAGEWPNVWLGVSIESPAYIWRGIMLVDDVPQTVPVKFISYEPALEDVNFSMVLGKEKCNWLIAGGESGHHARPFNLQWARHSIQQCRSAGVACFIKQFGSHPVHDVPMQEGTGWMELPIVMTHKGEVMQEWPADCRVQEFPR